MRLSLLAPDIVESALNGILSPEFSLERAMKPLPVGWELADIEIEVFLIAAGKDQRSKNSCA
jgi:hypothetical protein